MRGFLTGKHFNRSESLHPLFAKTIRTLHFEKLAEQHGVVSDECMNLLENVAANLTLESLCILMQSDVLTNLFGRYEKFSVKQDHGATAKC